MTVSVRQSSTLRLFWVVSDLSRVGLEKLTKERKGMYSIRINDQYRIWREWTDSGPCEVEITDYH